MSKGLKRSTKIAIAYCVLSYPINFMMVKYFLPGPDIMPELKGYFLLISPCSLVLELGTWAWIGFMWLCECAGKLF